MYACFPLFLSAYCISWCGEEVCEYLTACWALPVNSLTPPYSVSQVRSRLPSVRFLPLHRVRELADSFGLWQHPWPCSLSTSGLSFLHLVCCRCCIRLPSALQFSGWRTQWTHVSNNAQALHHFPSRNLVQMFYVPPRMNPDDLGDNLTFHRASPADQILFVQ